MAKWIWVFFFSCVALGMWLIYDQGIQPRSVKILKPSFFDSPAEFGRFAYGTLRPRFALNNITFIGHQPGLSEHDEFLYGFVTEAQKSDLPYKTLIVRDTQRELAFPLGIDVIDLQSGGLSLDDAIARELQKGSRILVYLNSLDAIHFNRASWINQFEMQNRIKTLTLALVGLVHDRQIEPIEECVRELQAEGQKQKYIHTIGCLLERKEQELTRKKNMKWDKFVAVIDQEGERDYILYTRGARPLLSE